MNWLIIIIVGGIIGWLASLIMKTSEQQGILANILVGIIGSLLAKWLFADVLGLGGAVQAGDFSLGGLLWGMAGAIVLLVILKALRVYR